ncbi:NADP-dependent 3-hydroxy acid dehydrogenase YdfG [Actinomycetospora succinea]|uniref:NADP-dependent 3-hydroxy acid dehydrogenase YdfG n=1 Tax=Actinomycetospora succinea TaxID=663603 RepID=A0A4R6V0C9_9PSEU|nr:SDR family oxidoreductase [Actinomycetospora succinea]TDQ51763.1 NADP-dependent 3-hydroxy acid dehydrogenase YdfG [Actinomycetospora succinea]
MSKHVALVTGGGGGIGAAVCARLAADGHRVAVVDRDAAAAARVAEECGGLAIVCDVTSDVAVKAAVDEATAWGGRLDLVVLNAGSTGGQSGVDDLDVAAYRRVMAVNVDHVVFGTTAALPALRLDGGGTVIATSSLAGLTGMPDDAVYTLTKHAVVGYVRSVAATLVGEPVRVMAVCPWFTDTALITGFRDRLGDFPLLGATDVADAVAAMVERGESGECWFVQPGREPGPFRFRGVPGPADDAGAPPRLHGEG